MCVLHSVGRLFLEALLLWSVDRYFDGLCAAARRAKHMFVLTDRSATCADVIGIIEAKSVDCMNGHGLAYTSCIGAWMEVCVPHKFEISHYLFQG